MLRAIHSERGWKIFAAEKILLKAIHSESGLKKSRGGKILFRAIHSERGLKKSRGGKNFAQGESLRARLEKFSRRKKLYSRHKIF